MRRSLRPLAALTVTLLLVGARVAAAQCNALCAPAANPCIVTGDVTLPSGTTTCDLAGRALAIATGKQVQVTGAGSLVVINAGGVVLEQNAKVLATGGAIRLHSLLGITLAAGTRLDASSSQGGGRIELETVAGDVLVQGRLFANNASTSTADGGFVYVTAGGNVDLGAAGVTTVVDVSGGAGDFVFGGDFNVGATGSVTLRSGVNVRGQEGGTVVIDAGGDVRTTALGDVEATAMALGGGGGYVDLTAGGDVVLEGDVVSTTNGAPDGFGGAGGDMAISAGGAVTLASKIDLSGGTAGDGGSLGIEAGTGAQIGGTVTTRASGPENSGGAVDLLSAGSATVTGAIDSRGGLFAGDIDLRADGAMTLAATSAIRADASATNLAGLVSVMGCTLTMAPGATILAKGDPAQPYPLGSIQLRGSSTMVVGGSLTASAVNRIEYRDVQPIVTGSALPAATLVHNPSMPCCVGCPLPTTTTTLPASTTTTTTSSTTTTTTQAPSTTTTTTLAPPTTTTTLAPPTTTTTLPPATTTTTTPATTTTTTVATTTSTTTTTAASTTTTTAPTSTTTSTTAAPTSSTTSTSSTSSTLEATTTTSTTLAPPATTSTTTTTAPVPTTTSTAPPASCLEEPLVGFEAVGCRLDLVTATFVETPAEALGGSRAVKKLTTRVARTRRFVDRARSGKKVTPSLRQAVRELKALGRALAKGERKGKIAAELATPLVALVSGAEIELGSLRATLR